ncbi:methylglyoxal synthase [Microbulbifer yueqingensis]|uniref:Methylglyoxal synthase n=1 Tax=Microbulbifer yueqingensis TaxID=658219 RepID=A0A1G8XRS7_9GAMM|nr:methylglyoxal synthase [Microbulbifer yueqingensis]SDJ93146.1 methylglyoxal synthase [Microbulbifer yueqingensis]
MQFIAQPLPATKRVALVAHDNRKQALIDWCREHRELLGRHQLLATGTTGTRIQEATGMEVQKLFSGPLGGDQQLGAKICQGEIDLLVFFWDPFEPMPHDPDVKALLRIAAVWNIPVACNSSSADMIVRSTLMEESFEREVPDYQAYQRAR